MSACDSPANHSNEKVKSLHAGSKVRKIIITAH